MENAAAGTGSEAARTSRRILVCWGAAICLVLLAWLFCWHGLVPFLETKAVVLRCRERVDLDPYRREKEFAALMRENAPKPKGDVEVDMPGAEKKEPSPAPQEPKKEPAGKRAEAVPVGG